MFVVAAMTRLLSLLLWLSMAGAAVAQTPGRDIVDGVLGGRPAWTYPGASVDMNFATGQYYGLNPSQLTVSRASSDSEVCNGQLYTFGNNVAPITPCGLWAWESRTNSDNNSSLAGTTIPCSSSCATPTNWSIGGLTGLTVSVALTKYINNIPTITINFQGTTTGGNFFPTFGSGSTATTYGATWTNSAYLAQSGSSCGAINGLYLATNFSTGNIASANLAGSLTSSLTYEYGSGTAASAAVTNVGQVFINIGLAAGAVNCNITVGLPQLELNPNLPASVASATVASGGVCTPGTYTFTVAGGTGTAATISGTVTGTTLGGTLTVVTPGSYAAASGLPASPATLTGGVCTTQPTVTLTPTNNAASAFATGPILTSGTAATRAQNTISSILARPASSIFAKITPQAPSGFPVADWALAYGRTNGLGLLTPASALTASYSAGGSTYSMGLGSFTQGTLGRSGIAYGSGAENLTFNGSTATGANSATVSGQTLYIGSNALGASPCNCSISRVALFPNKLSSAALGALQ